MTDPQTRQAVQQIVVGHVTSGTMFTAFDVTLVVRAQGVHLRHNDGRDIVHEMFQNGVMGVGYRRTVVDIGTGSTRLFIIRLAWIRSRICHLKVVWRRKVPRLSPLAPSNQRRKRIARVFLAECSTRFSAAAVALRRKPMSVDQRRRPVASRFHLRRDSKP